MKTIHDFNFQDKKALIRVDFNVPLNDAFEVTDTTRIEAAKSTIVKILEDGGSAVLMSHLGRPKGVEEKYSLTDQIRRSSRSVCANLAEAWRKRRYRAAFVAKLNDCEAEAAETQVWLKFAVKCQYLSVEQPRELYGIYNQVLGGLVKMITHPNDWLLK